MFKFDHDSPKSGISLLYYLFIGAPIALIRLLAAVFIVLPFCALINATKGKSLKYVLVKIWAKMFLACFGIFHVNVKNESRQKSKRKKLIVCNHVNGHLDGLCLLSIYSTQCSIVLNQSMKTLPIIGQLLIDLNCIFVNPDSSTATSNQIVSRLLDECDQQSIVVFPEGGCTNGTKILKFRSGAFIPSNTGEMYTGPISLHFIEYPKNYIFNTSLSARGEVFLTLSSTISYLMIAMCEPYHSVTIRVFSDRFANGGLSPAARAEDIRLSLSKCSGCLLSDNYYRDFRSKQE